MSGAKVDVLAALDRAIAHNIERGAAKGSPSDRDLRGSRAAVAEMIKERNKAAKWIIQRGQELRDHACADCIGSGDLVLEGWRCAYHAALAAIGPQP